MVRWCVNLRFRVKPIRSISLQVEAAPRRLLFDWIRWSILKSVPPFGLSVRGARILQGNGLRRPLIDLIQVFFLIIPSCPAIEDSDSGLPPVHINFCAHFSIKRIRKLPFTDGKGFRHAYSWLTPSYNLPNRRQVLRFPILTTIRLLPVKSDWVNWSPLNAIPAVHTTPQVYWSSLDAVDTMESSWQVLNSEILNLTSTCPM